MTPLDEGKWTCSVVAGFSDQLHETWIEVLRDVVVTNVDGEPREYLLNADDGILGWCLAMRTARMALWTHVGQWSLHSEQVDPHGSIVVDGARLVLARDGQRWRSVCGGLHQPEAQRSALGALLLSPRIFLDRLDILKHAPILWPVRPVPHQEVNRALPARIVDVVEVGRGHSVILELDLERLTLTSPGAESRSFASLRALFTEAIRIRHTVLHDPCVVPPPLQERDRYPPDGWEPWVSIPELQISAHLPEFNGRYWACNWRDGIGEELTSSGVSPLEMVRSMLSRAEHELQDRESGVP